MTKLISIMLLGLLWSGNVYSQVIEYNKCNFGDNVFQKSRFEDVKFIINTQLKTVTYIMILTDNEFEKERQSLINSGRQEYLDTVKKIRTTKALIIYLDNEYIKANYTKGGFDNSFTINKKKKTILMEGGAINSRTTVFCQ
jgi:hypothetical protein